jgi:hypothetical protein
MIDFSEPLQWRQRIEQNQQSIVLPQDFPKDQELEKAYRLARVLDRDLAGYFQRVNFAIDPREIQIGIREICDKFKSDILQSLQKEKENFTKISNPQNTKFNNIFEFAGCEKLYLSSKYTRLISEKLGHKFEQIAELSPYVFVPEKHIGLKMKGIDMIIFWQNKLYYSQIKTKKDTLTGSQVYRSINELKIHPYSMFVAALDMGYSSNPSRKLAESNGIELKIGEEFWSTIGIGYLDVLKKIARVLKEIENVLYYE